MKRLLMLMLVLTLALGGCAGTRPTTPQATPAGSDMVAVEQPAPEPASQPSAEPAQTLQMEPVAVVEASPAVPPTLEPEAEVPTDTAEPTPAPEPEPVAEPEPTPPTTPEPPVVTATTPPPVPPQTWQPTQGAPMTAAEVDAAICARRAKEAAMQGKEGQSLGETCDSILRQGEGGGQALTEPDPESAPEQNAPPASPVPVTAPPQTWQPTQGKDATEAEIREAIRRQRQLEEEWLRQQQGR